MDPGLKLICLGYLADIFYHANRDSIVKFSTMENQSNTSKDDRIILQTIENHSLAKFRSINLIF